MKTTSITFMLFLIIFFTNNTLFAGPAPFATKQFSLSDKSFKVELSRAGKKFIATVKKNDVTAIAEFNKLNEMIADSIAGKTSSNEKDLQAQREKIKTLQNIIQLESLSDFKSKIGDAIATLEPALKDQVSTPAAKDVFSLLQSDLDDDTSTNDEQQSLNKLLPKTSYVIYTDLEGFKNDQPNGLVQSEFYFTWFLNSKLFNNEKPQLFAARNMMLGINFTKLENNLRYKQVGYSIDTTGDLNDTMRFLNAIDLVRYMNLYSYIRVNFLTASIPKPFPQRLYVDGQLDFYDTGVHDTLLSSPDFGIHSWGYGINLKYATKFSPGVSPVNVELGAEFFGIRMHNNNILMKNEALYFPDDNPLNNTFNPDASKRNAYFWAIKPVLMYSPDKDKPDSHIFFRGSFYNNLFTRDVNADNTNHSNTYLQLQIGYEGKLSDLFPAKKETTE